MVNNYISITGSYEDFVAGINRNEIEINSDKVIVKKGTLAEVMASYELSGMDDLIDKKYKSISNKEFIEAKKAITDKLKEYKIRYLEDKEKLASSKISDTFNRVLEDETPQDTEYENVTPEATYKNDNNNGLSKENEIVKGEASPTKGWFNAINKKLKKLNLEKKAMSAEWARDVRNLHEEKEKLDAIENKKIKEQENQLAKNLEENKIKIQERKKVISEKPIERTEDELNAQLKIETDPHKKLEIKKQMRQLQLKNFNIKRNPPEQK